MKVIDPFLDGEGVWQGDSPGTMRKRFQCFGIKNSVDCRDTHFRLFSLYFTLWRGDCPAPGPVIQKEGAGGSPPALICACTVYEAPTEKIPGR